MRRFRRPVLLALAAFLLWALIPVGPLDCAPDGWHPVGPDGTNLRVCGRFVAFAMPGQGSDRPGMLVLRDEAGFLRGVTTLELARTATGFQPQWSVDRVTLPLHADMARPQGRLPTPIAWLTDAAWRIRATLGLVPADTSFR